MSGTSSTSGERASSSAGKLVVLMVSAFMDMVGLLMIIPLLPYYAQTFNASDIMLADGTMSPDAFRMSGDDAIGMRTQTNALKAEHPLASQFKLTLAYNGGDAGPRVPASCNGGGECVVEP